MTLTTIIGYGPDKDLPCIPDFILVRHGDEIRCILRSDPRTCAEEPVPGPHVVHDGRAMFADGMWVYVESTATLHFFLASNEQEFRTKKAQELAMEASFLKGEPVRALRMTEAAARLHGFDLPGLTRRLQKSRISPEETLEQILERVRRDEAAK